MIYVVSMALGIMCFDGNHHDYYDLTCAKPLERAVVVSRINCKDVDYFYIIPESEVPYNHKECETYIKEKNK